MLVLVLQRLLIELALDFFYFPIWWYTNGLKRVLIACYNLFMSGNNSLLPMLWLKNIFVPMYGQSDWQGRLVSVFIRLANVIVRLFLTLIWFFVCVFLVALWLLVPVLVVYMLYISIPKKPGFKQNL